MADGALRFGLLVQVEAKVGAMLCSDATVRCVQEEIAVDEARHAALGWEVVRWAVGLASGESARAQLLAEVATAVEVAVAQRTAEQALKGSTESLDAYGVLGPSQLRLAARLAVDAVIRPAMRALHEPNAAFDVDAAIAHLPMSPMDGHVVGASA